MVSREDVERAAETIRGRVHRTPVFSVQSLGCVLKAELFQYTGSFKVRGVLNRLAMLSAEERAAGVIGVSAGNHAQALAWGAAREDIDALVVMWQGASSVKLDATRGYGATVDLEAEVPTDAFVRLAQLRTETGRTFIHPFDDVAVVAGQGTVGLEILDEVPDVDTIVVPVGGGGLVAGIAAAVVPLGVRVVGVEPELSTALFSALVEGRSVPVDARSMADGLNAPFAGDVPLRICQELGVEVVLVSEGEIGSAMRDVYARAKLACEPSGAVGVAALAAGRVGGDNVVVVVSGGNVSGQTASAILGMHEG